VLCAFALLRGWSIVRFTDARTNIASNAKEATVLGRWVGVPGLSGSALETLLASMANAAGIESARRRAELLTDLLAVRPLSPADWLSLAGMRLVTMQPYPQVLAALSMSSITGPDEGWIMWPRGIFGLLQWQGLAPDARQRAIDDLAGAIEGGTIGSTEMRMATIVLESQSPETRAGIAQRLQVEGLSPTQLASIGLAAPTAGSASSVP